MSEVISHLYNASGSDLIAKCHGFDDATHLARALSDGAWVLDASPHPTQLGERVAALNPNIRWQNLYIDDQAKTPESGKYSHSNAETFVGKIDKLDKYDVNSFDAVFSYMLLQELSTNNLESALHAAKTIFNITKPGGLISIGPIKSGLNPLKKFTSGVQVIKNETIDDGIFAERIVSVTRAPKAVKYIQAIGTLIMRG